MRSVGEKGRYYAVVVLKKEDPLFMRALPAVLVMISIEEEGGEEVEE